VISKRERVVITALTYAVSAIIQMGDPRHTASKSYDVGTSINDGVSLSSAIDSKF
jgi:hypothetical protein